MRDKGPYQHTDLAEHVAARQGVFTQGPTKAAQLVEGVAASEAEGEARALREPLAERETGLPQGQTKAPSFPGQLVARDASVAQSEAEAAAPAERPDALQVALGEAEADEAELGEAPAAREAADAEGQRNAVALAERLAASEAALGEAEGAARVLRVQLAAQEAALRRAVASARAAAERSAATNGRFERVLHYVEQVASKSRTLELERARLVVRLGRSQKKVEAGAQATAGTPDLGGVPQSRIDQEVKIIRESGIFDIERYRRDRPEVDDPILDYVMTAFDPEAKPVRPCPLFDHRWYLGRNASAVTKWLSPFAQFLKNGWRQGRDPHPLFDVSWYLDQYQDVRDSNENPLVHFIASGASQGRDPNPYFRTLWYRDNYMAAAPADANPLVHYVLAGKSRGSDPSPGFNMAWFRAEYPYSAVGRDDPLSFFMSLPDDEQQQVLSAMKRASVQSVSANGREGHSYGGGGTRGPLMGDGEVSANGSQPRARYNKRRAEADEPLLGSRATSAGPQDHDLALSVNLKAQLEQARAALAQLQEESKRVSRRYGPEIDDLKRKLWGGLSQTAITELTHIVRSEAAFPEARAAAAWELARFHLAAGNPAEAAGWMARVRANSKARMRQLRARLVEIEALSAIGDLDLALRRVQEGMGNDAQRNNMRIAHCNVLNRADQIGRYAEINAILSGLLDEAGLPGLRIQETEGLSVFSLLSDDGRARARTANGPKVSILFPAFNAESHMRIALESLTEQTWRNIEIVAVDDASEDATWSILSEFAARDERIVALRNESNMGAYPTRNRALRAATGQFITTHDSDDWSHSHLIESQVQPLLQNEEVHGTFSMMCRTTHDLVFKLRPSRDVLEYIHRSYPSLMMRRADVEALGGWDGVRANADDEFVRRARKRFGEEAFVDVHAGVPLSIFLTHEQSLTESAETSLRSLTFGVRHEYAQSAAFWGKRSEEQGGPSRYTEISRVSRKEPFPCPELLLPRGLQAEGVYDIVLISDLSLLGGTRSCNLGYINVALAQGLRVGLFHWPRGDLKLVPDIAFQYRELSKNPSCDILTCEQSVKAAALLIHHPPILKHRLDRIVRVETDRVGILVNQLPRQTMYQSIPYYDLKAVSEEIEHTFSVRPVWLAISPLVERHLRALQPDITLASDIWYPPSSGRLERGSAPARYMSRKAAADPVLGRHGRDHWTKWPASVREFRQAYGVDDGMTFRVLGGANAAPGAKPLPPNWQVLEFDSVDVSEFLQTIDIYVNYNHKSYIEEFGRNVMEAMGAGVPVIASPEFVDVFGDTIIPAEPDAVVRRARELWQDEDGYLMQVERGFEFVERNCGVEAIAPRLLNFVNDNI